MKLPALPSPQKTWFILRMKTFSPLTTLISKQSLIISSLTIYQNNNNTINLKLNGNFTKCLVLTNNVIQDLNVKFDYKVIKSFHFL